MLSKGSGSDFSDFVLCSGPKFGPHPGGSYGGQGGLSFYVGAKGM